VLDGGGGLGPGHPRRLGSVRTKQRRLRVGLAVALVLLLVAVLRAVPPASAQLPTPQSFLQFNMCGHACHQGTVVVDEIVRAVTTHQPEPSVVMLEEVCRSQYIRLDTTLVAYAGHFETTQRDRCDDGTDYGIAVLVRTHQMSLIGGWELPNPASGEVRHLACVRTTAFSLGRPLAACVTHIDSTPGNVGPQIAFVAAKVATLRLGHRVILGGDFNAVPQDPRLRVLYGVSTEAGGDGYTNCGGARMPCGPGSGGTEPINKIDFVFLVGFIGPHTTVVPAAHSDHAMLWGSAALP
jgi:endonuclease/exonuclease/phosphatase family metal-dependent hydrolase